MYLFTNFFPVDGSETAFITPELDVLREKFSRIVIIPRYRPKGTQSRHIEFEVDYSLTEGIGKRNWKAPLLFFNSHIIKELLLLLKDRKFKRARKLWWSLTTIANVKDWSSTKFEHEHDAILYTYWFTDLTTGLALAKKDGLNIPLVSRAHGYDLYEERTSFKYFPLRSMALNFLDRLFLISQNGFDYMATKYPQYIEKYIISKLGVNLQKNISSPSENPKTINIVSCAHLRPVKRIDLLCDALNKFALSHDDWQIKWDHFGGGENKEVSKLESKTSILPSNVNCTLWGNVPNNNVLAHYKQNPVDFFISVSESEGIPVSVMEAMSFGIPVIATSVGGVPEIVNIENGYLLPANPSVEEISEAIWLAASNLNDRTEKRDKCRKMIFEQFNADQNYSQFASEISSLATTQELNNDGK